MPTLDRNVLQAAAVNLETMAREYEDRALLAHVVQHKRDCMEKFSRLHRISKELFDVVNDDRI
jgi:hypothetical protein